MTGEFAARGWHEDPSNPDRERFSDGTRWTSSRRRPGTLGGAVFFAWALGLLMAGIVAALVGYVGGLEVMLYVAGILGAVSVGLVLWGAHSVATQVDMLWRASSVRSEIDAR